MRTISEFADSLNEIMPVLMREFSRKQPDVIYKGKVTLPQVLILDFLNSNGPVKMKDVASFMKVSMPAITGIVNRLVNSGYALRIFDNSDRRIIKVQITSKGEALVKKISQDRRNLTIKIFDKIPQEDRENYLRILSRVRDVLCSEDI